MKQNGSYYSLTSAHKIILLTSKWAFKAVGLTSAYWSELPTCSPKHNYCSRTISVFNQGSLARRKQCAAKQCLYMIKENKYPSKATLSYSFSACSSRDGDLSFCTLKGLSSWRILGVRICVAPTSIRRWRGLASQLLSSWHFNKKWSKVINDQTPVSFLYKQ